MKLIFKILLLVALIPSAINCASSNDIFPSVPTSTSTSDVQLPNPIAIVVDTVNGQLILVNSNVDFFFDEGSLATLSVDASNTNAVVLAATSIIATPNFGGNIVFDGTSAYVPFRESPDDTTSDQVKKYTIGSGSITEILTGRTGANPFGSALFGTTVLVVSEGQLDLFNSSLTSTATVSFADADNPDDSTISIDQVENVIVDATSSRAFITNRLGKILVVDLTTNTLTHQISAPLNTRGIATDGTYIYVVDGNPPALWIFDPAKMPAASSSLVDVDDSTIVVDVIDVGTDPNGIAIDTANSRVYVANSFDESISVIDTVLFEEIDRISLGDPNDKDDIDPFGLAVGTFNSVSFLFVTNISSNTISVINTATLKVVSTFP